MSNASFWFQDSVFSLFDVILDTIHCCIFLILGLPKCVYDGVLRLFNYQNKLKESIPDPDMIIIQDYLGTIVEENEEVLGCVLFLHIHRMNTSKQIF